MLRKLNCFLNIVIGSSIGVFIGFGIYKFWHFKTYPNLYAIQSAPWYTEPLLDGALVAVVVVVCIILSKTVSSPQKSHFLITVKYLSLMPLLPYHFDTISTLRHNVAKQ